MTEHSVLTAFTVRVYYSLYSLAATLRGGLDIIPYLLACYRYMHFFMMSRPGERDVWARRWAHCLGALFARGIWARRSWLGIFWGNMDKAEGPQCACRCICDSLGVRLTYSIG